MEIDLNKINTFDGWNVAQELELVSLMENGPHFLITNLDQNWQRISEIFNISNNEDSKSLLVDQIFEHIQNWNSFFGLEIEINQGQVSNEVVKLINECYLVKNYQRENIQIRPIELSAHFRKMNGYRPARGEFETEYNDKFELRHVSNLNPDNENLFESEEEDSDVNIEEEFEVNLNEHEDNKHLEENLRFAILDSYNSVIRERYERKHLIKEFGLLFELNK